MFLQDQNVEFVIKFLKYGVTVGVLYDGSARAGWVPLLLLFLEYSPSWFEESESGVSIRLVCIMRSHSDPVGSTKVSNFDKCTCCCAFFPHVSPHTPSGPEVC